MFHSGVRVRHTACSRPAHHRPLPTGNTYLRLYIDDVPTDGGDDARRLILALAPDDKELVMLCNEMQAGSYWHSHLLIRS